MLFLGTEKYPDESQYDGYLSQHGGVSNAYTSSEETNYHFKVNHEYLETAIDMVAIFIVIFIFIFYKYLRSIIEQ